MPSMLHQRTVEKLIEVAKRHPEGDALVVGGVPTTYFQLFRSAAALAAAIRKFGSVGSRVAVLADRTLARYAGFLATMLSGTIYVPLSPNDELERYLTHLETSQACCLVFDLSTIHCIQALLPILPVQISLVAFDVPLDITVGLNVRSSVTIISPDATNADDVLKPVTAAYGPDLGAYVMFTSGSTGSPKGVLISHGSLDSYLRGVENVLNVTCYDRVSQIFDPTFDLSIHDILIAWTSGACLVPLGSGNLARLGRTIRDEKISIWFSVPSLIQTMDLLNMVIPSYLSSIRVSLFCGEPLSTAHVRTWQGGAHNSSIFNLYGPTEATIAVSSFQIPQHSHNTLSTIPIGRPFGRNEFVLLSPAGDIYLHPTAGQEGELGISGPQLADGYLTNADETKHKFLNIVVSDERSKNMRIYRTGDRVRVNKQGEYEFLGRIDSLIRLKSGYFIDLRELETQAAHLTNSPDAVVINKPRPITGYPQLYCFLVRPHIESDTVPHLASVFHGAVKLSGVFKIDELPRLLNGKLDRGSLAAAIDLKGRFVGLNAEATSKCAGSAMKGKCSLN